MLPGVFWQQVQFFSSQFYSSHESTYLKLYFIIVSASDQLLYTFFKELPSSDNSHDSTAFFTSLSDPKRLPPSSCFMCKNKWLSGCAKLRLYRGWSNWSRWNCWISDWVSPAVRGWTLHGAIKALALRKAHKEEKNRIIHWAFLSNYCFVCYTMLMMMKRTNVSFLGRDDSVSETPFLSQNTVHMLFWADIVVLVFSSNLILI